LPARRHFQRNDTEEEVHAIEEYGPAFRMEQFFEVLIGLANDGKTDEAGIPSLLRAAVLHRHFRRDGVKTTLWRSCRR
jgi:hypothetical protein